MNRRGFIAGVGSAAASPLVARAQQSALPVIGLLSGGTEGGQRHLFDAFRSGLREEGLNEGREVEILYRFADTRFERLPDLAADLVKHRVSVIATLGGTAAAVAAKSATDTIPIVFETGSDPVLLGLVGGLSHPSGNLTGVTFLGQEVTAKRLELLHSLVPSATSIGYLANPRSPQTAGQVREAENAARTLNLQMVVRNASNADEIRSAFVFFSDQRICAIQVDSDVLYFVQREQLAELAKLHGIPVIFHTREMVEAGGLISYGTSFADAYRLVGTYAGRILKGQKPSDLPVQQSMRIELAINLKTARLLGLVIPPTLLALADEVIE